MGRNFTGKTKIKTRIGNCLWHADAAQADEGEKVYSLSIFTILHPAGRRPVASAKKGQRQFLEGLVS